MGEYAENWGRQMRRSKKKELLLDDLCPVIEIQSKALDCEGLRQESGRGCEAREQIWNNC
jgi:hypothetical protein